MDLLGMMVAFLVSLISGGPFCLCLLRWKCQVLEKKYFAPFLDLNFIECNGLEQVDFTIAVHCDMVDSLSVTMREIPLETDWLCLTRYQGAAMEAGTFSQLKNLKALSISGHLEFLPEAFTGLSQLSILWIESETIGHEDMFLGLSSLQDLKMNVIDFSFNFTIFNHLNQLNHLTMVVNNVTHLSNLTTSIGNSRNLPNLRKLSIICDFELLLSEEDCFRSPYPDGQYVNFNITFLELYGNFQLDKIDNNSLCNFPHLEVFNAHYLDFEMIHWSGIQTIRIFSLSSLFEDSVGICEITSNFKVSQLLITLSDLREINTFTGSCETLRHLDLSSNGIKNITSKQFQRLNNLLTLNLTRNSLTILDICEDESTTTMELIYLNVSYNLLSRLHTGQFACLKKLQILSLENNHINVIDDFSFRGLSQLSMLNLQNNNLNTLSNFIFANLVLLTSLNLYGNTIYGADSNAFSNLEKLQELMITSNVVQSPMWLSSLRLPLTNLMVCNDLMIFDWNFFYGFSQLQVLQIDAATIYSNCSSLYKFQDVRELSLNLLDGYECDSPAKSPSLIFPNLERFHYAGTLHDFSYIILNLLKGVPLKFLHLKDTEGLITNDQVKVQKMFQGLSQLTVLHLQNSGINNMDSKDLFEGLRHLEFLVIENEDIQELNGAAFDSMTNLKYVYFLETRFPCDCKFKELLTWLESGTTVSIINFHNQSCLNNHNTSNLVSFLRSNCHSDLDMIMFAVTFVFTLLFMCTSLFYESIWWNILYLVYNVKCWLNHRHQDGEQYEYDVFVSYNTHNELWVTEQLLPRLEENGPPFFRVCIHNRDFEVGKYIMENIMDSIYNSRWTVCVITRHYLQSNWCSLEMRMATYRLLSESKDSLILVFLDKISREELQYYHRLTKLLDKKTYLDWPDDENGQKLFWARLRKVIAKTGRKPSVKRN